MDKSYFDFADDFKKEIFKKRFKEQRLRNKFTMERLGEKVGLTRQGISGLENGRFKTVKPTTLKLVSSALRCTQDYLLGRSDDPRKAAGGLIQMAFLETEDRFLPNPISEGLTRLAKNNPDLTELMVECNNLSKNRQRALAKIIEVFINEFAVKNNADG